MQRDDNETRPTSSFGESCGSTIAFFSQPVALKSKYEKLPGTKEHAEEFNTRYASYRGWQMALERVKPLSREVARVELTAMVTANELATPAAVVDYFALRFLSVPLDGTTRQKLIEAFTAELGTSDVLAATSYMEDPLRVLLHMLLSRPE